MEVLHISSLTFGYEMDKHLFHNFNLHLNKGEIISIVGPSGSGKSTLLGLITSELTPLSGEIRTKNISQVFQDPYSSFHNSYTIISQIKDVANIENIGSFLPKIGLTYELLSKKPYELSGGQLQRASILRALLMEPDLLLVDEPTSALDNITQLEVMKLLVSFLDSVGILLITHDISLAKWCSDTIIDIGVS